MIRECQAPALPREQLDVQMIFKIPQRHARSRLTERDFIRSLGDAPAARNRLEDGKLSQGHFDRALAAASALGIDPSELTFGVENNRF